MANGDGLRIVKPGAGVGVSSLMDIGVNPASVEKFRATMREMKAEATAVLKIVEEVLIKAKELEALKNALSDG